MPVAFLGHPGSTHEVRMLPLSLAQHSMEICFHCLVVFCEVQIFRILSLSFSVKEPLFERPWRPNLRFNSDHTYSNKAVNGASSYRVFFFWKQKSHGWNWKLNFLLLPLHLFIGIRYVKYIWGWYRTKICHRAHLEILENLPQWPIMVVCQTQNCYEFLRCVSIVTIFDSVSLFCSLRAEMTLYI